MTSSPPPSPTWERDLRIVIVARAAGEQPIGTNFHDWIRGIIARVDDSLKPARVTKPQTSPKDAAPVEPGDDEWKAWVKAVHDGNTRLGLDEWFAAADAKKAPALPIKMDGQSNGPQVMDAVREVARRTVAEHGDDSCLRFFVTYSFAIEFGAEDVENWSRDMLQGVMAEHCITRLDQGHEPDSWELHEAGKV